MRAAEIIRRLSSLMGYFIFFALFIVAAYAWYRWIQQRDNIDENVTWDDGEAEEPLSKVDEPLP